MIIRDILGRKGFQVHTIRAHGTLRAALDLLCEERIGAVPVLDDDGELAGILSERDLLFQYCHGADAETVRIADVMTTDVIIGVPEDTVQSAMHTMTEHRIRHLPILESSRLVGLVSIGDVVKALRTETEAEARYLRAYITGQPAV